MPCLLQRLRTRLAAIAGFSVTETSAIVLGLSIVAGTAGPHLEEYLETARQVKVQGDVRVLAVSLVRLLYKVGSIRSVDGLRVLSPSLLVGDGAMPMTARVDGAAWGRPVDNQDVQSLTSHLVDNGAGYRDSGGFGQWGGPYLERVSPDPWGSRYGVNVGMLSGATGGLTVVVSAGPNRLVETPFELRRLLPGGDDVIGLVSVRR